MFARDRMTVMTDTISLVTLGPEHLEGALELSRAAGWLHRLEDWQMSLALSEGLAAVTTNGEVVGTILVTPYRDEAATINMVIVAESLRGRGLGRRLMQAAIDLAGRRPIRLVATDVGLPLYQSLGFEAVGHIVQQHGLACAIEPPRSVLPARAVDLPAIVELDRAAFGAGREGLLAYIAHVGEFLVINRAGRIVGYAGVRAFGRGEVIGPVVAEDAEDARDLIAYALSSRTGSFVRIDSSSDSGLGDWLAAQGLAPAGGGIAMQRPKIARIQARPRTFALASQAFG
jgi:ribosomal protein S18 acetylase RimI-like enzyme